MIGGHREGNARRAAAVTVRDVGAWYWIGVSAGLGSALGLFVSGLSGFFRSFRGHFAVRAIVVLWLGVLIGFGIRTWETGGWFDAAAGGIAAFLVLLGGAQIVAGTLRRGGTRGGTATLFGGVALVAAGLAFVPAVGFLEAVVVPALALRLRRKQPERYAGLRTLAKD
jgi:hypothetical protein